MATRTQKTIECDNKGCRRRTGVKRYSYGVCETDTGKTLLEITAEHCPHHVKLNVERLEQSVINTKEYPDPEDS